jgi:CRISPR system Cascade subunit CasE
MILSLIRLRYGVSPHDVATLDRGDGYRAHRVIWNLFADSPDRRRDFLYRHECVNGWPTFYAVSHREPIDNAGLWEITPKAYHPRLIAGQRLAFMLRVNPVRSKRDENGQQHRHDVIMEAKTELKKSGEKVSKPDLIQTVGERWLLERCSSLGFAVLPGGFRADGYEQRRLFKGNGGHPITFSTLDFNGVLAVADPDTFIEKCLYGGVGPAKGFGCGLMLVKRL